MSSFGPVAPHYDRLMDNIPYRMWTSYLLLLFAIQEVKPRKILDVCCGTGAMCELLADEGFDVTGFDLSEPMIELAREKSRMREIAGKEPIRYEIADAAEVDLGETFEAAYSFFDSLNYITDPEHLQKAIHRVSEHLQPGGSFVFDVNTAYAFEERMFDQTNLRKNAPLRYKWRGAWDPATRLIEVDMKFWAGDQEFREVHRQRAYSDEEIRAMLIAAGFDRIQCYHSYTLEKPRDTSDRLHYLARKRDV
jgi:SAM-dependent methyltransferase